MAVSLPNTRANDRSGFALYIYNGVNPVNSVDIFDPKQFAAQCVEQDVSLEPWHGKCNSYTCPVGPEPGVAYFLCSYGQVVKVLEGFSAVATGFWGPYFTLVITDVAGTSRTVNALIPTEWRCVSGGNAQDDNALYMVTFKDVRSSYDEVGYNGATCLTDEVAGTPAYNIPRRKIHVPNQTSGTVQYFFPSTLYSSKVLETVTSHAGTADSTLWTWAQMLTSLGAKSLIDENTGGGYFDITTPVTLPYAPTSKPMDWDLQLTSNFWAVHAILDRLSITTKFPPFDTSRFDGFQKMSLVIVGNDDGSREAALDRIKSYLLFDARPMSMEFSHYAPWFNCKNIIVDRPTASTSVAATAYVNRYLGFIYYSQKDMGAPDSFAGNNGIVYTLTYNTSSNGGMKNVRIDHDVPIWSGAHGYLSIADQLAYAQEHHDRYVASLLSTRQVNRLYAGFHTTDALLPGSMMKIVRWADTGKGPTTNFYAGDKYLPPHAIYHLVNPHRYQRRDTWDVIKSIDQIDLMKL